eukprot:scaffold315343_cov32-Tisochrysis_lutea.AAC.2
MAAKRPNAMTRPNKGASSSGTTALTEPMLIDWMRKKSGIPTRAVSVGPRPTPTSSHDGPLAAVLGGSLSAA